MRGLGQDQVVSVYLDHRGALEGFLKKRLSCPDKAAELTQDIYLRLGDLGGRFATPDDARRFIFRIAVNLANDHHASSVRRRELVRHYGPAWSSEIWDRPELREQVRELNDRLAALPPRRAEMLLRRRLNGETTTQIADRFGVSVSLVEKEIRDADRSVRDACVPLQ